MSKKPNLTARRRSTIRAQVRRICKAEGIKPKQLAELTGISTSAAGKLLSKPSANAHTKNINSDTAGLFELWLEDRAKAGMNNDPKVKFTDAADTASPAEKVAINTAIAEPGSKDAITKMLSTKGPAAKMRKLRGEDAPDPVSHLPSVLKAAYVKGYNQAIADLPSEGTDEDEGMERLEAEIRIKDRAINDLSTMNMELTARLKQAEAQQPGYIEGRREAIEIKRKYDALAALTALLLKEESNEES